jgi:hypothetical protein
MLTEIHLTVDTQDIGKWIQDCKKLQIKPLVIQLAHGQHPLQVMCTRSVHMYSHLLSTYLEQLHFSLENLGYTVLRTKVEVPRSDVKESKMNVKYYEAHYWMKPDIGDWPTIVEYAKNEQNPLSFSVLSGKWWVTQRWTRGLLSSEPEKPYWLCHYAGKGQTEAVLMDTNPSLDEGWAK